MIKNLLQEGFALKDRGHYKHAIEVFYKALEEDNTSTELLFEIADLYYRMQNEERALNYIEQILDRVPEHITALKLLEKIFIDRNALAEAEQTAKNIYCVSHNSNDLAQIFRLLNMQGRFDEIFEYNVENPNSSIYFEQAKALFYKKEFAKAQELLEKAIAEERGNQDILLLLGQVYYAQGKKDLCLELAAKISENDENAELLNFLGLLEDYKGNYKEACRYIQKAIKLDADNDKYFYNLAISLNPQNPNYHFALANLYYAEKHYKRALEELPDNLFEANLLKVIILYDTGYLALAKQELKHLFAECPDNSILQEYSERIDSELGLK